MGIFADYKAYKKYEPQYDNWKKNKDLSEAKKLEYLRVSPVDEKTKNEEIQRGKALLNAIDVMDEYSQTRAENMEVATNQAMAGINQVVTIAGMGLGLLSMAIPSVRSGLGKLAYKFPKAGMFINMIPTAIGTLAGVAVTMCMQGWAASKEVGASRKGRFEAMKNELADVKNFAVLTDTQKKKQEEIASNMPTTKDMKNGFEVKKSNLLNPLNLFSVMKDLVKNDKKFQEERENFDKNLYKGADPSIQLNENDILKAKRDQQLLHNVIEKIDMASQDYAENVELATQSLITASLFGGGLTGFITNKLVKLLKITNGKVRSILPLAVGVLTSIGTAVWATSVQKQASRVGRYLAKKEIEKDLNNFVYVDKEKTDKLDNVKVEKKEKPNFFKFIFQAFKDNAEYKNYIKTKGIENIKKARALKEIELTPEQEKEAKRLQKNAFKAFNKLDEKSQKYAESVEAVGEIIGTPITMISSLIGMGGGWLISQKMLMKPGKQMSKIKSFIPMTIGAIIGLLPGIINNIYFTKQQKQASRVAHMLALNEMSDYKNYIDYENLTAVVDKKTDTQQKKSNLFASFIK